MVARLQKLVSNRQQDKQNLAILDRRVQEERKQKMTLEQQLMAEKRRKTDSDASRKADDSSRAAVTAVASSSRYVISKTGVTEGHWTYNVRLWVQLPGRSLSDGYYLGGWLSVDK